MCMSEGRGGDMELGGGGGRGGGGLQALVLLAY